MGLHKAIIEWLRSVCPEAFADGIEIDWKDSVIIDDVLTRLRRLWNGPIHRDDFTGAELFIAFSRELFGKWIPGRAKVYLCCCDLTENVPNRKGRTQLKRKRTSSDSKGAETKIYPPEAVFSDQGIQFPGSNGIERFNIQTACSSRDQVREKLLLYLCDALM
jgi:hypothetical protein